MLNKKDMISDFIKCPYCGYENQEYSEYKNKLITYWGEEGFIKEECTSCEKEFEVREIVTRFYESRKNK